MDLWYTMREPKNKGARNVRVESNVREVQKKVSITDMLEMKAVAKIALRSIVLKDQKNKWVQFLLLFNIFHPLSLVGIKINKP